ncbi:hypothetical protein [Evansella halocellulosilytica]|uniref:hypothetical protein n=1 Tax=Evansella halocellulosilytica TaxID=2011013 RepID=UPI000BB7F219|nr:hypothetical protein [Evansella halocellulosilytica]
MTEKKLRRETQKELDRMVERVARKSGYAGGEITYKEHLQNKFADTVEKAREKVDKYRRKFSLESSNTDFAEEIKSYLRDGLYDLIEEGFSEEEALRITKEKFNEAELQESFEEFMNEFDDFGLEEYTAAISKEWNVYHGETVGLFYGGFTIMGLTIGSLIGFLSSGGVSAFLSEGWINTLIGAGAGVMLGVACGLISNAIFMAIKRK